MSSAPTNDVDIVLHIETTRGVPPTQPGEASEDLLGGGLDLLQVSRGEQQVEPPKTNQSSVSRLAARLR
ncbi:MAG: hypothetical protein WA966_11845 [Ornithinimicrobium sp.]